MDRREEVGNLEGSDSDYHSRIEGHNSNRPSAKVVGTMHNSGAHSVQNTRQESKSVLNQVDRQISPQLPESSAAETKRHGHPSSPAFFGGIKNIFGYNNSASQNDQVSTELAHEGRERSMQSHIDKLSAELETMRNSSQKYGSSYEELTDLKQQLAVLKTDLSDMRIQSQKYESRAGRYRQERDTLREAQKHAQHQSQAAIAAQETSRSPHAPRGNERELADLTRELRAMKSSEADLDARLKALMQEKAEALVTIKRLRDAQDVQASSQGTFSLDSFRDAVDQVSEAHVSFNGHPSVERLNESIDNTVLEALEQACKALAAQGDSAAHFDVKPPPIDTPLFVSLAKRSLTEEDRGFLLDACLHSLVVPFVYDMFFQSTISTIAVDDEVEVLDKIFSKITATEPWAVCQRWRAMTASATAIMFKPAELEKQAQHIEEDVSQSIAWAYGQPLTTFHPIRAKLLKNITSLMRDAHQLSLVLKRDILSVRVVASLRHGRDVPYDPQFEDSVWPEMGAKAGDQVIGVYGLGLQKVTPAGHNIVIAKPKVITSALLREIDKGR